MRILMTGISSIHGWPIYKALQSLLEADRLTGIRPPKMRIPAGAQVRALCITDKAALRRIAERFRPSHVVHCAGVCDLDVCEERPDWARAINAEGSRNIVDIFGQSCPIYYLSTDLVFSGNTPPPRGYSERHAPDPISVAGNTFRQAECEISKAPRHCIIRAALPLGDSVSGDKGAVDWVESRFKRNLPVTLFRDEIRSCIPCDELARATLLLISHEARGVFHVGGETPMSLHEMGQMVLRRGSYPPRLLKGIFRREERIGPPRIGNVSLDCAKFRAFAESYSFVRLQHPA